MDLTFSLKPKVKPVIIETDDGIKHNYELREMMAAERDKWLDEFSARAKISGAGKNRKANVNVSKFDGFQADLLTKCLFLDGQPVTRKQVQAWPVTMVSILYEEAQILNGLVAEAKEEEETSEKND